MTKIAVVLLAILLLALLILLGSLSADASTVSPWTATPTGCLGLGHDWCKETPWPEPVYIFNLPIIFK
jgi:hypothetical protein